MQVFQWAASQRLHPPGLGSPCLLYSPKYFTFTLQHDDMHIRLKLVTQNLTIGASVYGGLSSCAGPLINWGLVYDTLYLHPKIALISFSTSLDTCCWPSPWCDELFFLCCNPMVKKKHRRIVELQLHLFVCY